jgi:drug/metabolite transporter (DMT)-like permease
MDPVKSTTLSADRPAALPAASRLTYLAFLFVVLFGGSNAVAVRFSNLELPPFWGATLRFGAAALLFWAAVWARRIPVPRGRALKGALIFGVLTIGLFYAFLYWALLFVPASLTMVVLSLGPLLTFFFAWGHGQEAFRWRGLIGALVAFCGILIGVGDQLGGSLPLLPLLAIVAGAASLSEGTVLFKGYPRSNPIVVNAVALTIGTAMLLLLSLVAGEARGLPTSFPTWIAYGYLVLAGSGLLFYLYLYVLEHWTASATSYALLLMPVATILMAAWLADETITPRFLTGSAIVFIGVWLGAIAQPRT